MSLASGPNTIIHDLPWMAWRDEIAPPYDVAGFRFRHRQATIEFFGIDGAAHVWGGLESTPMHFRLYFLNSLEEFAFPDKWEKWQTLLFDGQPGKLDHPLRGRIDAVVLEGEVVLTAKATAGVVVDVDFTSTLLDPNKAQQLAVIDAEPPYIAAAAKTAIENAELNFPSGEPVTDLLDILAQIDSMSYMMQVWSQGQINQWQGKLDRFISIIQAQSPGTRDWAAGMLLINLWGALEDTKTKLVGNQARPTASAITANNTTVDTIARERKNTVGEIMGLNPALLSKSWVPKDTAYLYYTA